MISKLHTAAALLTVASLMACAGNSDKDYVDNSIIPPGGTQNTAASPANTTPQNTTAMPANTVPGNTTIVPGTSTPVNITPQTTSMNVNPQNNTVVTAPQMVTQQPAQTVTAPGMNPPHGQPGHRCDISVGAPLNSKPNAPAAPTTVSTQPQQPAVTMKEIPNTVKTAPGMNPPHGEPNHRCDIAVGAPLNSKPATPAVTQATAPPALLTAPKNDSSKN